MVQDQQVAEAAQPVGVDHHPVGHRTDGFTCNRADEQALPAGPGLVARRAVLVGELAAHGKLEAPLERVERLRGDRGIGDAVDGAPATLRRLLRPGGERAGDFLHQAGEPRLVALQAPDLAAPAGDLLGEPRHDRRAFAALALQRARLRGRLDLVARELFLARRGLGGEPRDLLTLAPQLADQLAAGPLDVVVVGHVARHRGSVAALEGEPYPIGRALALLQPQQLRGQGLLLGASGARLALARRQRAQLRLDASALLREAEERAVRLAHRAAAGAQLVRGLAARLLRGGEV